MKHAATSDRQTPREQRFHATRLNPHGKLLDVRVYPLHILFLPSATNPERAHPKGMEVEDIVIIGAGVAGLALASGLRSHGISARVLEARARAGGRTISFEHGSSDFDLGATWVWETETAVLGLLDELELEKFPSHRGGIDLYESGDAIQRVRLPPSSVPEFRIEGGTASIARRLAERVDVELSRPVRRIAADEDAVVLELDDETIRARHVVAAVPPALLGTTIELEAAPDDRTDLLRVVPVWMGDMAKVVAVYDEPFWLDQGLSGRVFSHRGPMVEVHDISGSDRSQSPALFGFVPRSNADGDWHSAAREQLERLFGPAAGSPRRFEIKTWWLERETNPEIYQPAHQLMGHPLLRRPLLDGRLHLGSTETAATSAGHIDGAVHRARQVELLLSKQFA